MAYYDKDNDQERILKVTVIYNALEAQHSIAASKGDISFLQAAALKTNLKRKRKMRRGWMMIKVIKGEMHQFPKTFFVGKKKKKKKERKKEIECDLVFDDQISGCAITVGFDEGRRKSRRRRR